LYDAGKANARSAATETRVGALEARIDVLEGKQRQMREEQIMDHQEIEFLPGRVERHKSDFKDVIAKLERRIERLEK